LYLYQQNEKIESFERIAQCKRIYQKFFIKEAELQVNVPFELVQQIEENLFSGDISSETFSQIQTFIFQLLDVEWFPKYALEFMCHYSNLIDSLQVISVHH
jgi:hypothetical protein